MFPFRSRKGLALVWLALWSLSWCGTIMLLLTNMGAIRVWHYYTYPYESYQGVALLCLPVWKISWCGTIMLTRMEAIKVWHYYAYPYGSYQGVALLCLPVWKLSRCGTGTTNVVIQNRTSINIFHTQNPLWREARTPALK